jgi:EmrB/QacA subfamily drug resistance transporter
MPAIAKRNNTVLWIVAVGFFMETLDSTIVNTALPAMAQALGESPLSMHSVVIAYSLTLAVLIPISGWVADRMGIRKTFLTAISVFGIGSILSSFSPNLASLVAARVVQGIGGSMLMPVGRLAILRVFPQAQFLSAMSFVAVPALIGPLVGPPLGGFLVEYVGWKWIFLINIPVGLLGLHATRKYMPVIPTYPVERFDLRGFLMLAAAMISLSLAFEGLSDFEFQHATVMMLVMTGFASLVVYGLHAAKSKRALFHLDVFRNRSFAIGLLGNLFARVGSSSMPFLIPLLLQLGMGFTPLQAGGSMVPVALAAAASRRFATDLIVRVGYRKFLMVNTAIVGAMIMGLGFLATAQPAWLRVLQLIVFGVFNSLQFSAMNSLTLMDLEPKHTASGNSLLSMTQMLAMSLGVANAGALLSAFHKYFDIGGGSSVRSFQATFVCLGAVTALSTWIFAQLDRTARSVDSGAPVGMI